LLFIFFGNQNPIIFLSIQNIIDGIAAASIQTEDNKYYRGNKNREPKST